MEAVHGVVVLLDAIGIRSFAKEDAFAFLDARDKLLLEINPWLEKMHETVSAQGEKLNEIYQKAFPSENSDSFRIGTPSVRTFGDTILLTWPLASIYKLSLGLIGSFIRQLLFTGLKNGLLFRGAISFGDFIESENTVLGPSISDAATWYELPDLVGVIATPSCGITLSMIAANNEVTNKIVTDAFLEYEVPIKTGRTNKMWAINWPKMYYELIARKVTILDKDRQPIASARSFILDHLSQRAISIKDESKYRNTLAFFDYCCPPSP